MTRAAALRSVDCPTCGAGLSVLGGGRVTTHVCGYCGSELDAVEGYKVLRRFADLVRPASPFAIGQEGRLWGVAFTVIGTTASEERHGGRSWRWVDHLLFSPTHGYVWLSVEDGHLTWTRRFRTPTRPAWLSPQSVEIAEAPPRVEAAGEAFRYYETSDSQLTFVEGEFTWRPALGDRARTVTLMSDRHQLHFSEGRSERETLISGYLPREETLKAFGATAADRPQGVHPLQPFAAGRDDAFLRRVAGAFALLCLGGALAMGATGRVILSPTTVRPEQMPATLLLPIDAPGRLVQVALRGDLPQGWAFLEVGLEDPEGEPVFAAGREVGFWSGYDSDGSWTEDARTTRLTFRPATAGTYRLEVGVEAAGLGEGEAADAPLPPVAVTAWGGVSSPFWLLLAALLFAGAWGWRVAAPLLHHARRWRGTDWTEED